MTINTNTTTRYGAPNAIREDLENVIYNISPTETPVVANASRDKSSQSFTEWQTDTLATASADNAGVEGDVFSNATVADTKRVGNYTQILSKTAEVSGSLGVTTLAGMKKKMGYEIAKKGKEVKRDLEKSVCSDNVANTGSASVARKMAGLGSWIITNFYSIGTGTTAVAPSMSGSSGNGYPQTAAVAAQTAAAFTEANLKAEISTVWGEGGDIENSFLLLGPYNKGVFSGFTSIVQMQAAVAAKKQASIIGGADVFVSDMGTISVVPSRFTPEDRAYILDPSLLCISYLRPFQTIALAKNADSERKVVLCEATLKVRNESGLGIIRDMTTSA